MVPYTIGTGIGSAPGPPMALRNMVPQERSAFDKVMRVGDTYCNVKLHDRHSS